MAPTYEEMKKHLHHEVVIIKGGYGDIILYCDDCMEDIETWQAPPVNEWHGKKWAVETGGEIRED